MIVTVVLMHNVKPKATHVVILSFIVYDKILVKLRHFSESGRRASHI